MKLIHYLFFVLLFILSVFSNICFAQSDLEGRIGMGFGWSYLSGFGDMQLKIIDDDLELQRSSIFDSPKIIVNKFGISSSFAIEPTIIVFYDHNQIMDKDIDKSGEITEDDKLNRNTIFVDVSPIISYAILQKESVNFYLKGGISFIYINSSSTSYLYSKYDKNTIADKPSYKHGIEGFILGVPSGIGIEWWILEQLSLDITTMMTIYSIYDIKTEIRERVFSEEQQKYVMRLTDNAGISGYSFSFGNYSASFNIVFWY